MSAARFLVQAGTLSGNVEIAEAGDRAALSYGSHRGESHPGQIGGLFWAAMRESGVKPETVNHIKITDDEKMIVATLHPVLEGARAVWMVLYRANRDSSCFRALPSRQRLGDALNAAFLEAAKDVARPHKP